MSEPVTPPAAGSSSAPAPSTATPAVAPTAADLRAATATSSVADLDSLLSGQPVQKPAEPAKPVEPPVVTAPPVVAPPADVKDTVDDDADPLAGVKGIKIKPNDFQEMEVMRLMKPKDGQKGLSLREAYAKVYPATAPAPAAEAPKTDTPAAPAKSEFDTQIETTTAEIAELEKKIGEAADQADTKEVSRLTREISKKERDLERLNDRKANAEQSKQDQQVQTENNTFRQKQLQARDELIAKYPQLGDKASAERQEFDAYVKLKSGDPDYASVFDSPRWPVIVGREFAEAKGLTGAVKPAPTLPDAPPVAPTAPRATSATVITPSGPAAPQFQPTLDGLKADLTKMSAKDLDSLLG